MLHRAEFQIRAGNQVSWCAGTRTGRTRAGHRCYRSGSLAVEVREFPTGTRTAPNSLAGRRGITCRETLFECDLSGLRDCERSATSRCSGHCVRARGRDRGSFGGVGLRMGALGAAGSDEQPDRLLVSGWSDSSKTGTPAERLLTVTTTRGVARVRTAARTCLGATERTAACGGRARTRLSVDTGRSGRTARRVAVDGARHLGTGDCTSTKGT